MQIFSLILTILFFVFILSGILWGIIRGLKKTISRGLFLIITSVILIFVTMPITKGLLNINLEVTSLTINDTIISGNMNLGQLLTQILKAFLGNDFSYSATIIDSISALIVGILSSIIYLILFWILKYLLLPINYLITSLIFRRKKKNPEVMAFSAFGENPEDKNNSEENNINNSVTLGSIFDPQNQPDEAPVTPITEDTPKKVDNSLFTQEVLDKRNEEAGLFIKNDSQIINGAPDTPNIEIDTTQQLTKNNKSSKVKKQKEKPDKFLKQKENKYRFWGGMVGAVVGLVIMINTMFPVYGLINVIKNANQLELDNLSNTSVSSKYSPNDITNDLENSYSTSVLGAVSSAIGFEAIGIAEFDTITTVNVNGKKVTLRKDINQLLQVLNNVDSLVGYYNQIATDGTLKNLTQEELDELLNRLEIVLQSTKEVEFVDALGDIVIPTISQILIKVNFKLTENVNVNYLVTNTLKSLSSANDINIFDEISNIIELIKYTNEQKLLLPIINSNTTEIFTSLMNVEDSFITNLVHKLYTLKTVDIAMPNILNIGLTLLSESIDFAFERCELDGSELKTDLTNILSSIIETAKSFDKDTSALITVDSLPSMGRLLNSLKDASFLSTKTYNSLLDYAGGKLSKILTNILPKELGNYTNDVLIENFENVTNWENDLTFLKNAINILRDKENGIIGSVVENSELREGFHFNDIKINEATLINIGIAFDKLENTNLFGTTHSFKINNDSFTGDGVSRLLYYILDIAKTKIDENENTDIKDLSNTLNSMQNNLLNNFPSNPGEKYWELEFKAIAPLIDELYSLNDGGEFEITTTLGESLDKASTSLMLGGDTTFNLIADMLKNIKSSDTTGVNGQINQLIESISTKLRTPNDFENKTDFWKIELTHIDSLMDIEFGNDIKSQLTPIGEALDYVVFGNSAESLRGSYLITHSDVRNILYEAIEENKTSITSSFDGDTKTHLLKAINSINNNIKNQIDYSFEFELSKLKILTDINLSSDVFKYTSDTTTLENNKNSVLALGEKLDIIAFNTNETTVISYSTNENSKIITRTILNTLISDLLSLVSNKPSGATETTATDTAIQTLIANIKDNISEKNNGDYVLSWKRELSFIHKLTEINSSMTYDFDVEGATNRTNLAITLDAIAFANNGVNFDDIQYNENKQITFLPTNGNSLLITRENLTTTVASILSTLKETATANTKEDVINDLIDNTTASIATDTPTTGKYSTFTSAFNDLTTVENTLTNKINTIGTSDINILKNNGNINDVDEILESFQSKPISGVKTTRKMAYVLLEKITIPSSLSGTPTATFYEKLKSEYNTNMSSTTEEIYYISSSDDLTDLTNRNFPFRKLINTLS